MKKIDFMAMAKANATDAAYRVAATQITNGTKAGILALLAKQGHDSDKLKTISDIFDTEFGNALIAMAIGFGLTYAPKISDDPRVQKLSEEFRVSGMATAGNAVIGVAMESFLPVVMNAISALPQPDAARIAETESSSNNEEEEEEEEEEKSEKKRMSA